MVSQAFDDRVDHGPHYERKYGEAAIAKGRAQGIPSQANEPQNETGKQMQVDLRFDPDGRMLDRIK